MFHPGPLAKQTSKHSIVKSSALWRSSFPYWWLTSSGTWSHYDVHAPLLGWQLLRDHLRKWSEDIRPQKGVEPGICCPIQKHSPRKGRIQTLGLLFSNQTLDQSAVVQWLASEFNSFKLIDRNSISECSQLVSWPKPICRLAKVREMLKFYKFSLNRFQVKRSLRA